MVPEHPCQASPHLCNSAWEHFLQPVFSFHCSQNNKENPGRPFLPQLNGFGEYKRPPKFTWLHKMFAISAPLIIHQRKRRNNCDHLQRKAQVKHERYLKNKHFRSEMSLFANTRKHLLVDTLLLWKLRASVFIITDPYSLYVEQNCLHDPFAEDLEASCSSPDSAQGPSFLSPVPHHHHPEQMWNEKCHGWPHGLFQGGSGKKEIWSQAHRHSTITCCGPFNSCQGFLSRALPTSQMCHNRTT